MSNKIAKPMANKIVVDDGSKVYTIENKRGKFSASSSSDLQTQTS